ncbi:MAG: L,D-transpeptidase family protein [Ilumatobacteraceae bacterium]
MLRLAPLAAAAFALALAACSNPSDPADGGAAEAAAPASVDAAVTAAATPVTGPDTTTPTTESTVAPTTTAPLPTEPPTTTVPPTMPPPVPTIPASYEPIAPLDVPLSAVGSRSGSETSRVQQRLLDLGFWLTAADGQYGLTTRQAVMAFQKYVGLGTSGDVDGDTAAALSGQTEQARATADAGTLVEVDKQRQLLFMVVDGRTQWIFNTSTGNGQPYAEEDQNTPGEIATGVALTPDGLHGVNRERPEGWWAGDLGQIYRPKYFVGGVAVHGSNSIPNYPASHGCVRVSTTAMDFIWDAGLMPMGIPVWVHGDEPV